MPTSPLFGQSPKKRFKRHPNRRSHRQQSRQGASQVSYSLAPRLDIF
ncbi:hypothetical protein [Fischerella sp. PCC 9605]|nr:hypothetical protein [Fischerella sp. PCC 9605]